MVADASTRLLRCAANAVDDEIAVALEAAAAATGAEQAVLEGATVRLVGATADPGHEDALCLRWLGHACASARARRDAEARCHSVINEQPDLVCRYLPDLTLTLVNDAYARYYHTTADELIGVNICELMPPDSHEWARAQAASLSLDNPAQSHEYSVWEADGTQHWYQWTDQAVFDEDGRIIEIQSVGRDLTHRRRTEEALRQSEEHFRSAFEHAPIGMVLVATSGALLRTNAAFREFLGYDADTIRRRNAADICHPDDPPPTVRELSDGAEGIPAEQRFLTADGRVVCGLRSVSLVRDASGRVTHFLAQVVDITERKRAQEELARQALQDPLTGLPNRALLLDRLEQAVRRSARTDRRVAVLFCDLDHFKVVNDSMGHEAGDVLLVCVAQRIRGALRSAETVARLGGDEFVVVCEDLRNEAEATEVATRIAGALAAPFEVYGTEIVVGASIGIAVADDRPEPSALIRDADSALYLAKERGRGQYAVCDEAVRARAAGRLGMQNALRHALERDELRLHFQPVLDAKTGVLVAAEALLRWEHPDHGLLAPGAFLGAAEEGGLIVPMGEWVLRAATAQLASWCAAGVKPQLWVNISARELARPDLVAMMTDILDTSGIDPALLTLEITESMLMIDPDATATTLAALKELGLRVAIDDFGTGYSSLSYLKRFPADVLKVDRSFVGAVGPDGPDTAIVAAVVTLAHALGLSVVAEGIETAEQQTALRDLGCDLLQGYHLGRPAPAEDLAVELLLASLSG